ncbi:MAG: alpha/beta fold hydrolase [Pseudomonadota bacterium]
MYPHFFRVVVLLISTMASTAAVATTDSEIEYKAAIAEITIPSQGSRMPGLIYVAAGAGPHPTLILLHGFPGNERNLDLAQAARRNGFNVVFFNYRGAWGAEGSYSLLQLADDVQAVLTFLRQPANAKQYRIDVNHLSLLGHSLGGYTALAAGAQDDSVVCVGAIAPANLGVWKDAFMAKDATSDRLSDYADSLFMLSDFDQEVMRAELNTASMEDLDTRRFGEDLQDKSVFMIVGDQDPVTPAATMFDPVIQAYQQVPGLELEHHVISGDHSFSWSRLELIGLVLDWLENHCQ